MIFRRATRVVLLASFFMTAGVFAQSPIPRVELKAAFPNLPPFERPVWMTQPNDGTGRFFVVEQIGRIHVFANDRNTAQSKLFLDLTGQTGVVHNEEGLLCMAFHPDYKKNGKFYVYYSAQRPRRTVLSEFQVSKTDPDKADLKSERILFEVTQPYGNHKGSTTLFGPDGNLYVSLGDGGDAGDPHGNGQSLKTPLGKILRINVDSQSSGKPYGIPLDNPFASGSGGALPEIWAYGLRNVWRMSFDRKTGALWAGDVGQDAWEEVDLIEKGGNYGWNYREGKHEFRGKPPPSARLIDPVYDYGRGSGVCVTGGYVYRGKKFPALEGIYIFADYVMGTIWGIRYERAKPLQYREMLRQPKNIASFAEDVDGELYVIAFDGKIYEMEPLPPK
jgi:glucose/arabinose dehydrogenase